jgi:hypothetical protein
LWTEQDAAGEDARPIIIKYVLGLQLREADSDPIYSLVEIRGLWDKSGE